MGEMNEVKWVIDFGGNRDKKKEALGVWGVISARSGKKDPPQ